MTERTYFETYRAFIDRINRTTDREIEENARRERSPLTDRRAYLDWRDRIDGRGAQEGRE